MQSNPLYGLREPLKVTPKPEPSVQATTEKFVPKEHKIRKVLKKSNAEVARLFVEMTHKNLPHLKGNNLHTQVVGNGAVAYSYGVPIAYRHKDDALMAVNGDKYSSTTSTHRNSIIRNAQVEPVTVSQETLEAIIAANQEVTR